MHSITEDVERLQSSGVSVFTDLIQGPAAHWPRLSMLARAITPVLHNRITRDRLGEEAMHWISTANACGYLTLEQSSELESLAATVGRPLGSMINRHDSFCL